ncbi:hypothetical protein [Kribbella solani]|uniref:Uncharacterized protein n=1 Tax=Kribbella solani TaxID=236067 RepID=A0A841E185_9ACTN|nr:hypothetical protein [Kribbella solani]MBB5983971.1 hypothetical protein [Kribbella solani]
MTTTEYTEPDTDALTREAMVKAATISDEYQQAAADLAKLTATIESLANRTVTDPEDYEPARPRVLRGQAAEYQHDEALRALDRIALYLHARAGAWDAEANKYEAETDQTGAQQ